MGTPLEYLFSQVILFDISEFHLIIADLKTFLKLFLKELKLSHCI